MLYARIRLPTVVGVALPPVSVCRLKGQSQKAWESSIRGRPAAKAPGP
jgi:hypothetical protein